MTTVGNGLDFESDHVIITGAASGIGRQIALEFGALNATVSIIDIEENPRNESQSTHSRILEEGGNATFYQCDLRDEDQVTDTIELIIANQGPPDVLVNNAGINRLGTVEHITVDDWDSVQDINVRGAVLTTKHCISGLRETNGCIVNIASIAGLKGSAEYATYAPSKAALINHTKQIAVDYGAEGIRANAVAPGIIDAGMGTEELADPETAKSKRNSTLLNQLGTDEDVAEATLFLASDAASYITGETLAVDGGWTT